MCGIAGIINKMPRAFDFSTFCVLGIANDSRGGDSCGVFIDGRYEYGVGKEKFFSDYFMESNLIYDTERSSIALVHCRKASVGKISKETAQPVVITDDYGKVSFVVMHNGTIYNYESLAKKYIPDIDITGMTDSQVMARIFYYAGYECLNEYNGGAVFAIVDYRGYSPKVMLFKGASKKTEWSKEAEEERPLFYCIDKIKRELVFSSIGIPLVALRKDLTVYSVKENTLFEFNGKGLSVVKTYSREGSYQTKDYKKTYTVPKSNNVLDYDDFYCLDYDDYYITCNLDKNIYSFHGNIAHGKMYISNYGRVDSKASKNPKSSEVWFFEGVMLKNQYCFRFLHTLRRESRLSDADFSKKFENVIRYLSVDEVYPIDGKWHKAISPTESTLYNGVLNRLFTCTVNSIVAGRQMSSSFNGSYGYTEDILSKKYDINFKTVRDKCKSLMK